MINLSSRSLLQFQPAIRLVHWDDTVSVNGVHLWLAGTLAKHPLQILLWSILGTKW